MLSKIKTWISRKLRRRKLTPPTTVRPETFIGAIAPLEFAQWFNEAKARPWHFFEAAAADVSAVAKTAPVAAQSCLHSADLVMQHKFDLLGSGLYQPIDRTRIARTYVPINWAYDPVRDVSFPNSVPYKEWDLFAMRPGQADIKFPWELARCQHFVVLGQAHCITGQNSYALEVIHQIEDFMSANPVGIGVNWTCTMDVALRAANWAAGLSLVKSCAVVTAPQWQFVLEALYAHGRFIFDNFENHYEVTSNHYLSNIVGLQALAYVFSGLAEADEWLRFCEKSIQDEMKVQINDDGSDFESSVPYHRLVLELFLGAHCMAAFMGRPFDRDYDRRLDKMAYYLAGVLRPDGLMPQIGDADDGRLYICADHASWQRQDPRHILAAYSAVTGQAIGADFTESDAFAWEAFWWTGDPQKQAISLTRKIPSVDFFPQAGVFVGRTEVGYLAVTNGCVGTEGFGNHKHNEQLGFEYHYGRTPFFVDGGSYVYTSDFAARNQFRSVRTHNTVCVNGLEQNHFNEEWLFRMFQTGSEKTLSYGVNDEVIHYHGQFEWRHETGVSAIHERTFELSQTDGALRIRDKVVGSGVKQCEWNFLLAPGCHVTPLETEEDKENASLRLAHGNAVLVFSYPTELSVEVMQAAYSPSYGVQKDCLQIRLTAQGTHEEVSFACKPL
jgi:hypothetical protein